ncbi:hypothetical protein OOK44_36395 [Streptomyces cellulosae]|uniref:hypothetical protein n=1 Tax=Streptomyces TaxID=1883 RepID=UPI002259DE7C|nr:hypothetical protein [Streptomyces cellulosae]WTB93485.1 hypothetical protein OIE99_35145 [Streptomyces cellulosae]WTC60876.1 hypothetical protein OH715_36895 [Streptomyces cellulosae]
MPGAERPLSVAKPTAAAKGPRAGEPPATNDGGCCAGCPIAAGCALASNAYVTCPITGSTPPPAPPAGAPAPDDADAPYEDSGTRWSDVASRGVETAVAAAFGFGWLDPLIAIVQRTDGRDAQGNPVDWARLQPRRNGLSILFVSFVPLGEHTAAAWAAEALTEAADAYLHYGLGAVFLPLGACLVVLPVVVGREMKGVFGALCRGATGLMVLTARIARRFLTSRLGWIVTRPALWAGGIGLLLLSWRFIVSRLTGA